MASSSEEISLSDSRRIVLNAFRPNVEAELPQSFAGRKEEILALADALLVDGSCPVIFGERGLGKSSLALQLERIALGDVELLSDLGSEERVLSEPHRFVSVAIACTDEMSTPDKLFQGILNEAEGYASLDELPNRTLVRSQESKSLKLKVIEVSSMNEFSATSAATHASLTVEERLVEVLRRVHQNYGRKVLVIIDELDRVKDTSRLAGFIKNHCNDWLKFVLVGIASNVSALLNDHQSVERKILPTKIAKMTKFELGEIVDGVQELLWSNGIEIQFEPEATDLLANASRGFPWYVHLFGQDALLRVFDRERHFVTETDIRLAIEDLAASRFAQQFGDVYLRAVRESRNREIVLRLAAFSDDEDIAVSMVSSQARQIGVGNTSLCKRQLTEEEFGHVLSTVSGTKGGVVRFRNAMFRRYVQLRMPIFQGVAEDIRAVLIKRPTREDVDIA